MWTDFTTAGADDNVLADCMNWTSSSDLVNGNAGRSDVADSRWAQNATLNCANDNPCGVYCIEQ